MPRDDAVGKEGTCLRRIAKRIVNKGSVGPALCAAIAVLARQRVTRTFERYVAPEIVREILKEGSDSLKLGGTLCDIAVLFVDIRGFTTMSERLAPEEVVLILNRYLAMTSGCIENNRGTLDKFVGDATMAFWGAPLPVEDSVYLAAKTALEIARGADALSETLKREIGEELRVGVGFHYGPAVVGNMGSELRMDYTAIGDTVNTAAVWNPMHPEVSYISVVLWRPLVKCCISNKII